MSYDVSLMQADALGDEHEVFWRNYTSNTAIMWREAGCDLAEFHDKPALVLAESLRPAVADMANRPSHYGQWDADNGWGNYAGTLAFLAEILDGCDRYPDARVDVCR